MKKKSSHHRGQDRSDRVRAKKFLGQHFLKDERVAERISRTLELKRSDCVLEIGPGMGVLTKHLLKQPSELTVIEVDRDSVAYLREDFFKENINLSDQNFTIIEGDFLNFDLSKIFPGKPFAVIGNFPYNISSQILFKTLENRDRIPEFSGMFQKEVAKRICEGPGNKTYGILSVLTQAYYHAEYLFSVPPGVFSPPPRVDSGVLKLTRKADYSLPCDESLFFKVVKIGFQQRRKTLRNSLKRFDFSPDLKALPVMGKRPEQLSVDDFIALTNTLDADRKTR